MRWRLGALILLCAVALVPAARAHPGWPIYTPHDPHHQFDDCSDDYGYHNLDPNQKGHDIVLLGATEKEVGGQPRFVVGVMLSHDSPNWAVTGSSPLMKKETVSFVAPRGLVSATISTRDDKTFTVTGDGVLAGVLPAEGKDDQSGDNSGHDSGRFVVEIAFPYSILGAKNGDRIRAFAVQGEVESSPGSFVPADYAPGLDAERTSISDCPASNSGSSSTQAYYVRPNGYPLSKVPEPPPNKPPVADFSFSPASASVGQTVTFTDLSSDPDGSLAARSWDFGDGHASSSTSPTHAYESPGDYAVRLVVTDAAGATASAEKTIRIHSVPIAPIASFAFTPDNGTIHTNVSFTDASTDANGDLRVWEWAFGDGNVSETRHPTHRYARPGSYNATLRVTDAEGLFNVTARTVTIRNLAPTANFTWLPVTVLAGANVTLHDRSNDTEGNVVAWQWSFGDGANATGRNATHVFAAPGSYRVNLTVTDEHGATNATRLTVTIRNRAPIALFEAPASASVGETLAIEDASRDPDGSIVAWSWTFGDGASSSQRSPTHAWSAPGERIVTLRVTDDHGATHELSRTVLVTRPAVPEEPANGTPPTQEAPRDDVTARFTVTPIIGLVGEPVMFTDASGARSVASRAWTLGDGATATTATVTHTYLEPGDYDVEMILTLGDGSQKKATHRMTILSADDSAGAPDAATTTTPPTRDPPAATQETPGPGAALVALAAIALALLTRRR